MKLVGNYRAIVTHADVGMSKNDKPVLKVTFDVTDEYVNGQWMPLSIVQQAVMHYSLGLDIQVKSGKTSAQRTAEQIKDSYGYTGPLSDIGKIVLSEVELVCEDHNRGNFTSIKYVNNPNKKKSTELAPFASDRLAELDRIFASIAG